MSDFNASDRKAIRRREKDAKRWELERANVVVDLMSSPYGRRWIWEKLELSQCFQVNANKDTVLFTEGQRSIGNALMNEVMTACPEQFILAMREANGRSSTANAPEPGTSGESESGAESFPDDPGDADASERSAEPAAV